jgi:hypothetical protein
MKVDYKNGYTTVYIYDSNTKKRVNDHCDIDGEWPFTWIDVHYSSKYNALTYDTKLKDAKEKIQSLADYLNGDEGYSLVKNRYAYESSVAKSKYYSEIRHASREADFIFNNEIRSAQNIVLGAIFTLAVISVLLVGIYFIL